MCACLSPPSSEKCVEVFLYQLYAMLKADPYNVALLSGKVRTSGLYKAPKGFFMLSSARIQGLLETLLDAFDALFQSTSEKSISKFIIVIHLMVIHPMVSNLSLLPLHVDWMWFTCCSCFFPACCRLICRIAEVLGSYQISSSETRKLFLRLQCGRVHLVRGWGARVHLVRGWVAKVHLLRVLGCTW